jgi:hypothetical protein
VKLRNVVLVVIRVHLLDAGWLSVMENNTIVLQCQDPKLVEVEMVICWNTPESGRIVVYPSVVESYDTSMDGSCDTSYDVSCDTTIDGS